MCGRYRVYSEDDILDMMDIVNNLNRTTTEHELKMREVKPSESAPVISKNGPEKMTWSYYNPKVKRTVLNARIDNPVWTEALKQHHVAIPTTGFYEWTHPNGKKGDQFLFLPNDESLLFLAGIYVYYTDQTGQRERRFLILTTDPNDSIASYHDRMPLYIGKNEVDAWVNDSKATNDFLRRPQPQYVATPVGSQQISLF